MVPEFAELYRLNQIRDANVMAAAVLGLGLLLGWAFLLRSPLAWLRQLYLGLIIGCHLCLSWWMFLLRVGR